MQAIVVAQQWKYSKKYSKSSSLSSNLTFLSTHFSSVINLFKSTRPEVQGAYRKSTPLLSTTIYKDEKIKVRLCVMVKR